jgi:2'-5' RNA ligase
MGTRTFISVNIENRETLENLVTTQKALNATEADIKPVEPENIHITLKFLGEIPETQVQRVKEKISEISFTPIKLEIEETGVFPNLRRPRVIWAGVRGEIEQLGQVFIELEGKLESIGFKKERRRFQPHITIGRVRSGRNREKLVHELLQLQNKKYGEITVNHISFMKSELTRQGPIYTQIATSTQFTANQ